MTKKHSRTESPVVAIELIEHRIYIVRGLKVMIDADLAALYQVETRAVIQAVRRNPDQFPKDFMVQLTAEEFQHLRSQSVISSWGGRRYMPYAFTEPGVAMLSAVLKSTRAVQMSVLIVRASSDFERFSLHTKTWPGESSKSKPTRIITPPSSTF